MTGTENEMEIKVTLTKGQKRSVVVLGSNSGIAAHRQVVCT